VCWLLVPAIVILVGLAITFGLQPLEVVHNALGPVEAVYEHLVCGMQHVVNDIVYTGTSCR
jgi:hypothetical protein